MKKLTLILAIAMLVISVTAVVANTPSAPTSVGGVVPYIVNDPGPGGNVSCSLLGYEFSSGKVDYPFANGEFYSGIDVTVTLGTYVAWTSSFPIGAVVVKGSNDANVYEYDPASLGDSGLAAPLNASGGPAGLSNLTFCWNENEDFEMLYVSKTVDTSFTRTHNWEIDKAVSTELGYQHNDLPKIWLYTNGSGDETATWTVDVTYKGYTDSVFLVYGDITIENTGTLDAVITDVADYLAGEVIDVTCDEDLPYTLLVGDTLTCSYSEAVDGFIEGFNIAKVTTLVDVYSSDPVEIIWGNPDVDTYATVEITDTNAGFAEKYGQVFLNAYVYLPGDVETFTYEQEFAYTDYAECGDYRIGNTATIVETRQSADATLLVNVQCFVFEGETAWAANGNVALQLPYPGSNWATYVEYAPKTTTLFAGRTIPVGTVSFSAVSSKKVTITVNLDSPWQFEAVAENLKVQDYKNAPTSSPSPGLFAHKKSCDAAFSSCSITVPANKFYGVHVEVGQWVPDPNFGP
jgi:hypothetical protein